MLRNSQPLTWSPKTVTDSLDSSYAPKGSMAQLADLIPDPSTSELWQCRPAITRITNFPFLNTPGFISAFHIAGDLAFGLIASNRTPGFDEPFVFNLATNAFVTVSGITGVNVPASPLTTGDWTPPTMDIIGARVVVTHPGFAATASMFGWFDITNPAAPAWAAGTTAGAVVIATVPSYVAQFNGRAYFIVNTTAQPAVVFSDPLNAIQVTNASQVLTFDDAVKLTALGQLRLWNQSGGIIQGLIVFKGVANMYQVTGDSALGTLSRNALNVATGTLSPLGIAATSKGLAFLSPDGMRIIDFQGNVTAPLGQDGKGVSLPFIFPTTFSRMVMACGGDLVRITTQNSTVSGSPFQEWWYDLTRGCWSGPHTSAMSLVLPYKNTFIGAPVRYLNSLWQSDPMQGPFSSFFETLDPTVRILLALNGPNASTQFPDTNGGVPHVFTAAGTAQIDTAVSKFGGGSLKLDGVAALISTPARADLNVGAVPFTARGWFNCNGLTGTSGNIMGQSDAGSTAAATAWYFGRNAGNVIAAQVSNGAALTTVTGTTQFTNLINPGFHHVELTWDLVNLRLFIDGVQEGGNVPFAGPVNASAQAFCVGNRATAGGTFFSGWLDDVEVIIGTALHTANFVPPTLPASFLTAAAMSWTYAPSLFPDIQQMVNVSVSQTLFHCAIAANTSLAVLAVDPNNNVLNNVNITVGGVPGLWGIGLWGTMLWGAPGTALTPRIVPWTKPIVFAKFGIVISGPSNGVTKLGQLHLRYKILKYLTNTGAVG